ncbi:MAG: PIN domain-containing protein, partial [Spirochaetaceae bacterium]|nr:PIN domain-containing protein [Spirochaetaceae bacterium]
DVNLIIALAWPNHIHHAAAKQWFSAGRTGRFATCPITESGFIRLSMNPQVVGEAASFEQATHLLTQYRKLPDHAFWPLNMDFVTATSAFRLSGHRQVTDAYLLAVAAENGGRLATFDTGIVELIPSGSPFRNNLLVIEV